MAAGTHNIVIEQGATFLRTLQILDSLDAPVNLSDVTVVRGQIRKTYSAPTSFAFSLSVSNAALGLISWSMSAAVTETIPTSSIESYVYDVELVRADSIERILQGTATIYPEVTR